MALSTSACAGGGSRPLAEIPATATGGYRGDPLGGSITLSARDLSDVFRASDGRRTTLGALQRGHLMLVYFGYTHCPDVCPTTMADLGLALRRLPSIEQAHTQVVFVTSDPQRDTPGVLRAWLANFDPSLPLPFVGLTSRIARIDSVARSIGIPLHPPVRHADGSITVQHGAQTIAFVRGRGRLLWTAGTSQQDYAHDIGLLLHRGSLG